MTPQDNSTYRQHDDEISLVDLATILIRRWKSMAVIFGVVVGLAVVYAFLAPRAYTYSSIYSVAEQSPGSALESPAALVAKAKNLYLGPVTRELLEETGLQALPFGVDIENPEQTMIVVLSSESEDTYQELVNRVHQGVLDRLMQSQQQLVESRIRSMERQLANARESLAAVRESTSLGAAEVTASLMGRIAGLEANLADITQGEVGRVAVQSLEPAGTSRSLILALGIVLGAILAIIGAFMMQFSSLVRSSLKENG